MIRRARPMLGGHCRKPRASGDDPESPAPAYLGPRVNPARAGMILLAAHDCDPTGCKPRASGDDPPVPSDAAQSDE